jgi:3-dehydroquinate synthase
MVAAARISCAMGLCKDGDVQRLTALLERIGLPTRPPELKVHAVLEAIIHDKKVQDERIRFILPERIGEVVIRDDVDPALIGTVLQPPD